MEIIRDLNNVTRNENCTLTLGTFDGVHLGHQSIIKTLIESSNCESKFTTLITFDPHPQFVVKPSRQHELKLLTSTDEKIEILNEFAIDRLIIIPFTKEFSQLSPYEFIEDVLVKRISFKKIILGYDHSFGAARRGNYEILEKLKEKYDYSIVVVPPFSINEETVSSTAIRNLLIQGNVKKAAKFLGRNYKIKGEVITGEGIGRQYQVPTANIAPLTQTKLIPKDGIYAVLAYIEGLKYKGVLYIGYKPTFNSKSKTIELHIFNFNRSIYTKEIAVEFIERIRDDKKFDNVENLMKQIHIDKDKSLEILSNI